MVESYCCFDHIVFLLDTPSFESPPSWLTDNFHITEGGEHTGGLSRNKLVIFADGTYIELINFTTPPPESSNPTPPDQPVTSFTHWTSKLPGLIDVALTTLRPFTAALNHSSITKNLTLRAGDAGLGISYASPNAGSRTRKDGKQISWETTRPEFTTGPATPDASAFPTGRIDVPFFCHDVTPRIQRVPWDDESLNSHPSQVTGVTSVDILVPPESLSAYSSVYASITGSEPVQISQKDGGKKKGVYFELVRPTSQEKGPRIMVRVPTDEEDEKWLKERGVGVRSVALGVKGRKGSGEEKVGEGIGSVIKFVW